MEAIGIICEYNPFHLGHASQMAKIREEFGPDAAIVCLMSGNFVQRGEPAIFPRMARAQAALQNGADLVLEMPVYGSLSSAEGFARTGVRFLSPICTHLCFGTESGDAAALTSTAEALLSPSFPEALRSALKTGISFPAARQMALEHMGLSAKLLSKPNDILGVEYCKAILETGSSLVPFPIFRPGDYHSDTPDPKNPSATALRKAILCGNDWESFVPPEALPCLASAPVYTLDAGQRAILYRMRTMTDADFEALPYGSEGLWRRLMHAARQEASLEDIFTAVKTKRYTRTRLNRMVLCAFLGITEEAMQAGAPYARILGFTDRGRELLKKAKGTGLYRNIGESDRSNYSKQEGLWANLYQLFRVDTPGTPGLEERVIYHKAASF